MIDMHSHILWGLDDGSQSLDMSVSMLRMAVEAGTTDVFATPHVNRHGIIPSWNEIMEKIETLQQKANEANIPIRIHPGAEVELNYDTMQFIKEGSREYCLAESRYLLIELTEQSQPKQVQEMGYELMMRGFVPVLAHPERYDRIMEHPGRVLEWMQHGLLTQSNTGSFIGAFGNAVQKRAEDLMKRNMICFLGSDAHRIEFRTTNTQETQNTLQHTKEGQALLDRAERYGRAVIQDKVFYPDLPDQWNPPKKSLLKRIFGK